MSRWPGVMSVLVLAAGVLLGSAATATAGGVQAPATAAQTTPLLVSATNAPLGVLGNDGMEHLEYDLILTNIFPAPLTLTSLDVTAPDGSVLLHLAGDALAAATQPVIASSSAAPISQIPAEGSVATVIDLAVPPDAAPAQISHRIAYALPADAPDLALLSGRTVSGPDLTVDPRAPIVLAPPVQGAGWLSANGCCDASSSHRATRLVVNGARYVKPETFAIDWLQLQHGLPYSGDGSQNEQYFDFGADVVAAAAGTVISVRDDMAEQTPNQPVVGIDQPADFYGNHVVVQIQPGVWALYAHLQPGSIAVQVGDQVATGQILGRLGNTGNSTAPHLHFELSDGPDILTANSVPFVFDRYTLAGTVDVAAANAASAADPNAPPTLPIEGTPEAQAGTYPLVATVQNFP